MSMQNQATPEDGQPPPIDWQAELARHERWLRTIVRARVREPEGVDEVMQEVAVAAVRQKSPVTDPTKVAPWLYRVAVMQSLLFRRTQGRRRKLHERFAERVPLGEADASAADPLEWLLALERREQVRQAVDTLPGRDAELLMLKYDENWSYQRIADQIALVFDIEIDKDVVRRVLARHYRPEPGSNGPSWLTFLGHSKDSLWSVDLFRCESLLSSPIG